MIPYGRQSLDDDDVAAVVAVLKGDWLTQGPHIREFEEALAERTGARHAVTFSSGTAALHAVGAVSGLGPGDVVATSPLSFVASANCARYAGASTAFVDIDPETLNLDLTRLPAGADGVVAVHYAGLPVDLSALPYRPRVVIEDAAHALGATTADGPVGNCARSDACIFSFHPVKAITTGEGGAVTTNDAGLAERLRRFRNHAIERRPELGAWYYEVTGTGFNYRMTDIQAAVGLVQLAKLDSIVRRRRELAARYHELLAEKLGAEVPGLRAVRDPEHGTTNYQSFWVMLPEDVPVARNDVLARLAERGVSARRGIMAAHLEPAYAGHPHGDLPVTEAFTTRSLILPLYHDLTAAEQDIVVDELGSALRAPLAAR